MPSCVWHLSNTIAWSFAFPADAFKPGLRSLFGAKLAGEAVNQLTPFANLGGEPLKAYLLTQRTPGPLGMASVVIDKAAQFIVGLTFTVAGLIYLFNHHDLSRFVPASYQLILAAMVVLSGVALWLLSRKRDRLFGSLFRLLRGIGIVPQLIEQYMGRAERIDTSIGHFFREHKVRFCQALFFQSIGWFMGICETYTIVTILDTGIEFGFCVLLASLTTIINCLSFSCPPTSGSWRGARFSCSPCSVSIREWACRWVF